MAVGPHIEEGAELLKNCRAICLGMHATLNAEWDLIKWLPVTPTEKIPSLLTLEGTFAADPSQFLTKIPDTKQILVEFDNQLDLLTKFGLNIQYVDTHMLPEFFISGLHQAMDEWVKKKGLINHIPYYRFPSKLEPEKCNSFDASLAAMFRWLDSLKDDGYFSVMHPAKYSREMLLFTNSMNKEGLVAKNRDREYQLLRSHRLEQHCNEREIQRVRYDQAESQGTTFEDLQRFFTEGISK